MYKKIIPVLISLFLFTALDAENVQAAYFKLAEAFKAEKNIEEAISYYNKALERDENHLPTLLALGKVLFYEKEDCEAAISLLEKRLQLQPNCAETDALLADAFLKINNIAEAIHHYKHTIAIAPKQQEVYLKLIDILIKNKKTDEAIEICQRGIANNPSNTKIRNKLIDLLKKQKAYEQAIRITDELIQLQPDNDNNKMKKAHILSLDKNFDVALAIFQTLLEKHPNHPHILFNIAYLNKNKGKIDLAIETYNKLLTLTPNDKKIYFGLGQAYITKGEFQKGWEAIDKFNVKCKTKTTLTDLQEVAGKSILIQGEWYTNDMLQFVRYAKLIKDLGAKEVIVQAPQQLESLFKLCPYIDKTIIINKKEAAPFNRQVPIMSLPKLFATTVETVPADIPYIHPPQDLVQHWSKKIKGDKKIKVGIYAPENSEVPLEELICIANIENISLYILHRPKKTKFLETISFENIIHQCGKGFNFSDNGLLNLAAIIKNLDLVISCDSATAHLAGAVGTPVWLMLKHVANWRWMQEIDYSPWYPTMRLFRQPEPGDWQTVIENITTSLEEITKN